MKIQIENVGHELSDFATKVLRRKISAVLNRMSRFGKPSPVNFKVTADHGEVSIKVNMNLDQHPLNAIKRAKSEIDAVNGCIGGLLRQFDKIRLHTLPVLRQKTRSRIISRTQDGSRLKMQLAKIPSQILEELYPALRRMATEKVALYQATTSLEPGYLDPDEIVDDVLVDMIGTLDPASSSIDLKKRFLNAIEAMIKARVMDYENEAATVISTDGDPIEPDEKMELSTLGDEILDFWVLDEQLFLEDVMESPDLRSPEDIVSDKEARHVLMNALLRLPARSRYVFTSYVMDENSIEEVAAFVSADIDQVEQILRSSIQQLRSFLSESASTISSESVMTIYRRMAERFQVDPVRMSRSGKSVQSLKPFESHLASR